MGKPNEGAVLSSNCERSDRRHKASAMLVNSSLRRQQLGLMMMNKHFSCSRQQLQYEEEEWIKLGFFVLLKNNIEIRYPGLDSRYTG